ncbi:hypothetical protein PINS_up015721 [Pythium insidiosum]|nr:hypothetical protein PINS_up015721 [Pythium insidiosum]
MPVMAPAAAGSRGRHARHELRAFIPEGRWKLDASCGICGVHFGYLRGRHHCRYCGMSVCGKHSRSRAVVPTSMSTERQRVCDVCYPKCQYGLPLMRRRGYTTADGVPMTTRTNNGLDFEIDTSTDSKLYRSARNRSQRARTFFRFQDKGDALVGDHDDNRHRHVSPDAPPQPEDERAAPQRRRGQSEPPEQTSAKIIPRRHKFPSPSPKSPGQITTEWKPLNLDNLDPFPPSADHDEYSHSASSSPCASPPLSAGLDSSYASVRETTDQDAIALQYLSFVNGDVTTLETSRLLVSHERSDPVPFDATVIQMQPAPQMQFEVHLPVAPAAISVSPQRNGASKKPQIRATSSSSTCTVSVSDSDELDEEKPLEHAGAGWDVDGGRVSDTVTEESASFFGDDDPHSDLEPTPTLEESIAQVESLDNDSLRTSAPVASGISYSVSNRATCLERRDRAPARSDGARVAYSAAADRAPCASRAVEAGREHCEEQV